MPKRFEIVICPLLNREQMHHNIAKINQDPPISGSAFHALRHPVTLLFSLDLCRLHQSAQLRLGFTAAYDEVICKNGLRMEIQHEDVDAFFVLERINQYVSQFETFQITPPNE